ncbi:MAG: thymidine kinase [Peptostreptococcaceae bacterium]
MGKLYYYYGTMNSSKSANLLMKAHQFEESGAKCLLLKPRFDIRDKGVVASRIGLSKDALLIGEDDNVYEMVIKKCSETKYNYIFIDEVQFLSKEQIRQIWEISTCKEYSLGVFCFGLRTDYLNKLFEASAELIVYADEIHELKAMCRFCKKKATTHIRVVNGKVVKEGVSTIVGDVVGEERYESVCQSCYRNADEII